MMNTMFLSKCNNFFETDDDLFFDSELLAEEEVEDGEPDLLFPYMNRLPIALENILSDSNSQMSETNSTLNYVWEDHDGFGMENDSRKEAKKNEVEDVPEPVLAEKLSTFCLAPPVPIKEFKEQTEGVETDSKRRKRRKKKKKKTASTISSHTGRTKEIAQNPISRPDNIGSATSLGMLRLFGFHQHALSIEERLQELSKTQVFIKPARRKKTPYAMTFPKYLSANPKKYHIKITYPTRIQGRDNWRFRVKEFEGQENIRKSVRRKRTKEFVGEPISVWPVDHHKNTRFQKCVFMIQFNQTSQRSDRRTRTTYKLIVEDKVTNAKVFESPEITLFRLRDPKEEMFWENLGGKKKGWMNNKVETKQKRTMKQKNKKDEELSIEVVTSLPPPPPPPPMIRVSGIKKMANWSNKENLVVAVRNFAPVLGKRNEIPNFTILSYLEAEKDPENVTSKKRKRDKSNGYDEQLLEYQFSRKRRKLD